MHSTWSDGEGSIADMANAAVARNYEYIAITDHAKGLKIAGGIDERQIEQQAAEIETVNRELESAKQNCGSCGPWNLNLNPAGEGDLDENALAKLISLSAAFIHPCGEKRIRRAVISRRFAIRHFRFLAIPAGASTTTAWASPRIGHGSSPRRQNGTRPSKSTPIQTGRISVQTC